MKIQVFQSDKGDCLLLTGADGKRVLADGGIRGSFTAHVAPTLNRIQRDGEWIDVVYVSHIDQDHIAGILKMADDLVAWKTFDFQSRSGNTHARKPNSLRPPEIKQVWNNAFHDQVGKNADEIEDMLAAQSRALTLIPKDFARDAAETYAGIAHSKAEAVKLSRRLGTRQLSVPVNPEFANGLMFVTDPPESLKVGGMNFTVIGPFAEELDKLRDEWNQWLRSRKGQRAIAKIRRDQTRDEDHLHSEVVEETLGVLLAQASQMGDRNDVTLPNLASLMFFLEEDGKKVLLTGDGHWKDILDGLEATGVVAEDEGLHVDVLKIQHHGSHHNWHHDFGMRITADHYVFCGNGSSGNPEPTVVDAVLDSRIGRASQRSKNPETDNPFKMWFNCSSDVAKPSFKTRIKELETILQMAESRHPSQVKSFFLKRSFFSINL